MHNSLFNSPPALKKHFATHELKHDNWKDGESYCKVHLCKSSDEHIKLLRSCYNNKIHFQTDSHQAEQGLYNLNKFEQAWKLVLAFKAQNTFKYFLKELGDNQQLPLLFASIFFNCHTEQTINFIVNAVGDNPNLQKRHPVFFAYDIITGWIPECILSEPFGLEKSGCDSDYKLKKGKKIDGSADFKLGDQSIELAMDYQDKIKYHDIFNLRYNKWKNMQKPNSNLLILCTKSWRYYLYPLSVYNEKIHAEYTDRIEAWSSRDHSTKGYELSGWNNLKPNNAITKMNLLNTLKEIKSKYSKKFPSRI